MESIIGFNNWYYYRFLLETIKVKIFVKSETVYFEKSFFLHIDFRILHKISRFQMDYSE